MTQHSKCDYMVTPEHFLRQILYAYLAGFCWNMANMTYTK